MTMSCLALVHIRQLDIVLAITQAIQRGFMHDISVLTNKSEHVLKLEKDLYEHIQKEEYGTYSWRRDLTKITTNQVIHRLGINNS